MRRAILHRLSALALLLAAGGAAAAPSDKASARLVAGGGLVEGAYRAAIVIELAPDALTYWRNPGEAGVPPTFDFSGSDNLAKAEVAMPAPGRFKEAGGDVFGYEKQAAFALSVAPADAAKPVRLAFKMDYAACERICIPMHAEGALDLAPGGAPGPEAGLVAAAFAAVPRRTAMDEVATIAPIAGAERPSWRIAPKKAAGDLFPEAPDGWFFETSKTEDGAFRLVMAEHPRDAGPPKTVRLTMPGPAGAVEFEARLDGGRGAP